jgi:hypothetical protein
MVIIWSWPQLLCNTQRLLRSRGHKASSSAPGGVYTQRCVGPEISFLRSPPGAINGFYYTKRPVV